MLKLFKKQKHEPITHFQLSYILYIAHQNEKDKSVISLEKIKSQRHKGVFKHICRGGRWNPLQKMTCVPRMPASTFHTPFQVKQDILSKQNLSHTFCSYRSTK